MRRLIGVGLLLWVLAVITCALAPNFVVLVGARMVVRDIPACECSDSRTCGYVVVVVVVDDDNVILIVFAGGSRRGQLRQSCRAIHR